MAGDQHSAEESLRRRLQTDESERDGSDSSCSESVGGGGGGGSGTTGAFRPTGSPKDNQSLPGSSYPSPNISVGPPIHPPPHLLPYLYPHGLYPPHNPFLHNPAAAMNPGLNPSLLFNAQLALAAQHPALFGHYSGHSPTSPLQGFKSHRFSPYNLPGLGSAFDAVTPGSNSGGQRSLSSSPRPRPTSHSPPSNRPISVSPVSSQPKSIATSPQPVLSVNTSVGNSSSPSELKSIEKMVNGLEVQKQLNGGDDQQTKLSSPTIVDH